MWFCFLFMKLLAPRGFGPTFTIHPANLHFTIHPANLHHFGAPSPLWRTSSHLEGWPKISWSYLILVYLTLVLFTPDDCQLTWNQWLCNKIYLFKKIILWLDPCNFVCGALWSEEFKYLKTVPIGCPQFSNNLRRALWISTIHIFWS